MPTAADVNMGVFGINSVDRLRFAITKDGDPWTGIDSVSVVFEDPGGNQHTRSATLETPDAGVWYYDTQTTGDIDEAGRWSLNVRVTNGAVVKRYPYKIVLLATDYP